MATIVAKLLPRFLPYDELGWLFSMFHGSAGWANFAIESIPNRDESGCPMGAIFTDILEGESHPSQQPNMAGQLCFLTKIRPEGYRQFVGKITAMDDAWDRKLPSGSLLMRRITLNCRNQNL